MLIHVESVNQFDELTSKGNVVVDFYANWCGPCKMLTPVLEELVEERSDLVVVKVDVDKFHEIASKYSVSSIPTIIIFKDGKEVNKNIGFLPKPSLVKFIDSSIK